MKLKPIHENIIVTPIESEEKVGSVFLPNKKDKDEGKVIAVSIDVAETGAVKVGDTVGYMKFAGHLVESTDPKENRIIMDIHDILYVRS